MKDPYLKHLKSGTDLETTYEAIRAGFVTLALEKNRRATPFVQQARALKTSAEQAKSPAGLLDIEEIQPALLTAANQLKPHTFFIGAAIERKMAAEIWDLLESGVLENAANLTDEKQIASITRWLCAL